MPTGYTADLEGVTFPEFALRCARAFGALITLRDDPLGTPIPDQIEPSKHHQNVLKKSFETLVDILSWDDVDIEAKAGIAYAEALKRQEKQKKDSNATRNRYEGMLTCVIHWTPPTSDHQGLKDFMLKQLRESIEFDCSYEPPEPTVYSGQEYKHDRLCAILQNIEDGAKSYQKALKRSCERTEWIRSLRNSLIE